MHCEMYNCMLAEIFDVQRSFESEGKIGLDICCLVYGCIAIMNLLIVCLLLPNIENAQLTIGVAVLWANMQLENLSHLRLVSETNM